MAFLSLLILRAATALAAVTAVQALEWTSFGDSYASAVGAGTYTDGSYRCLRYDQAYPNLINADPRLGPGEHVFHHAACSGSSTADVETYQFYDEDTSRTPNVQFGAP
jgi:hypothetical protein